MSHRDLATSAIELSGMAAISAGVWIGLGLAAGLVVTGAFLALVGWLLR